MENLFLQFAAVWKALFYLIKGAGSAVETVFALHGLRSGRVPPTINSSARPGDATRLRGRRVPGCGAGICAEKRLRVWQVQRLRGVGALRLREESAGRRLGADSCNQQREDAKKDAVAMEGVIVYAKTNDLCRDAVRIIDDAQRCAYRLWMSLALVSLAMLLLKRLEKMLSIPGFGKV